MDGLANVDVTNLSPAQRDALMTQVKQQIAMVNAQTLIAELSEKCLSKCISKPGTSLDSTEKQCLSRCMDRFMETWNHVSQAYQQRVQQESFGSQGSGNFGGFD
uniref:Mitochondrial import inner membrane translocase subunit n=2 Tax=Plectus sambesii TaxID=2011161 RepID=A0A914V7T5_9BILA